MKKLFTVLVLAALAFSANAQFTPGRVLTAGELNTAIANPTITGGSINNAPIGQGTPAAGKFTTLQATTSITGNLNGSVGATVPNTGTFTAIRVTVTQTPVAASTTCATGAIVWDNSYLYVCVATNTWKRAALATW